MRHEYGRTVEVESIDAFDALVADGARTMAGWHVQGVDLRGRTEALARLDAAGALLLGCRLTPAAEHDLRHRGALLFPRIPDTPVDVYRTSLYSPVELYQGLDAGYEATPDARAYAWARQPRRLDVTLAQALHDHAVDDALRSETAGHDLVGVMGGHALVRGSHGYRVAADLGRQLAATGLTVCSGGGPGAMEAANLGAYLSGQGPDALDKACTLLAARPDFAPAVEPWAEAAFEVLAGWPDGVHSFGVPTWHYGHEPPNAFATRVAKYFKNAIREDVLLHLCSAGIVFLPGAGGTVQEIFQDACENYYADPATVAPMVLVGREYWTERLPAWPLLQSLASGRPMARAVHLVDTVEEAVALLAPA